MSNYYSNQINDYKSNYDTAMSEIDSIIHSMESLLLSFSSASGADVVAIKSDINSIKSKLIATKTTISEKKKSTITKASNSDIVYDQIVALPSTPTFKSNDFAYESTGEKKVFIENGIIYWEEKFRKIPLSAYDGLFGGIAAVGKLFDSYPIIANKTYEDVESMFNGVIRMKPFV